jgi:hypothetical protein
MTATHAQTTMQSDSIDILCDVLFNLNWYDIPTDVSEIDANWCYNRLYEYCAGEVREHLQAITYKDISDMADMLKELCNESASDNAHCLQGRW